MEAAGTPVPSIPAPPASVASTAPVSSSEPTDVGFFASLPIAVEASMVHLPVESIVGDEPGLAPSPGVAPSLSDDTVTSAPADDPFLLSLFSAPEAAVHPEAIPIVSGKGRIKGSRRVARTERRRVAAEPKLRVKKLPRSKRTATTGTPKRGPASTLLSIGAMLFSGALLVGTTVPANAFITFESGPSASGEAATVASAPAQTAEVAADATVGAVARDAFTVTSYSEVLKAKYGTRIYTFAPTSGSVRWPFPYATPISSGYGDRVAPCRGCSSHHNGVDFTPGSGTPIYAIADGVVTQSQFSGSFGQHVYMDHVINGQKVESIYGHMIGGSSPLVAGQTVKVGDLIGLVGSTGASTGAHLHLEIHVDGVVLDPFAWLQANAVS